MTAYTRSYVFFAFFDKFCHPFGIGQKLTCNTDCIYFALGYGFSTYVGFHTSCTNYRNIDEFFNVCNVVEIAVLRHIHWRMRPIPRIVSAVIGIKHIITCILQEFNRFFRFLHISAHFGIIFVGHCTVAKIFHF